jgi:polyferredoxin
LKRNGLILAVLISPLVMFAESGQKTAEHANETSGAFWSFVTNINFSAKYITIVILGFIVVALLLSGKMKPRVKVPILLLSTFLFGFAGNIGVKPFSFFGMHPSPMCVTKALLYGFGIPFILTLGVILFLTLIGPRVFCGYICPVGAIQELITMAGEKLKIRRLTFSFPVSQIFRLGLFAAFIFLSATGIIHIVFEGEVYASSIYDYINAFHGLEFESPGSISAGIFQYLPLALTVILAFKYYRPFCHFVCPVGLFTHWAEQISLLRINLNNKQCTSCLVCVRRAPCQAMTDILRESTLRPDCFGCHICIDSCPEKALSIGLKKLSRPGNGINIKSKKNNTGEHS